MKQKNDEGILDRSRRGVVKTGIKYLKNTVVAGVMLGEILPVTVAALTVKGVTHLASKMDEGNTNKQKKLEIDLAELEQRKQALDEEIKGTLEMLEHIKKHPEDRHHFPDVGELKKDLKEARNERGSIITKEIPKIKEEMEKAESNMLVKQLSKVDQQINETFLKGVNMVKDNINTFKEKGLVSGTTKLVTNVVSQVPGVDTTLKTGMKIVDTISSGNVESGVVSKVTKEVTGGIIKMSGLNDILKVTGGKDVVKAMVTENIQPGIKSQVKSIVGHIGSYFNFWDKTPKENKGLSI